MMPMHVSQLPVSTGTSTEELDASNQARLHEINTVHRKTVSGIDTELIRFMLEEILPPDAIARARRRHAEWLSGTLDEIESNIAKRVFTDLSQPGG